MGFQVTDEALSKLDALDDNGKRAVLAKLSPEERAQIAAAVPKWKAQRPVSDPIETPERESTPGAMDGAQAVALGLMPFKAVTRRMDAARYATMTKGQQLLAALGLPTGEDREVSDAIDRPAVKINGRTVAPEQHIPATQDQRPFGQLYNERYDQNVALEERAMREHPGKTISSEIVSALLTPMPKGGKLAKNAGALAKASHFGKQGAIAGALFGAGGSRADVGDGDLRQFITDSLIGAGSGGALGGATGAASGAGSRLLEALGIRAQRGVGEAVAAEKAAQEALAAKNIASAKGSYGSSVQNTSRDIEVMMREAAALPEGHPVGDAMRAYLNSAEGLALREQLAANKLASAPERMAEMQKAKATLDSLVAGKTANVEAQTAEALKNPVKKHVAPRLLTLGHRLLPAILGAAGGAIGGTEGAIAGSAVGGVMSLTQGLPGRILKNMMEKPATRKAFWEGVFKSAGFAQNAGMITALETAAEKGPQAFAATAGDLIQNSDEGAALLGAIYENSQPTTTEDRAKKFADILKQKPKAE